MTALERATTTFAAICARRVCARDPNLFGGREGRSFGRTYEALWPFADAWSAFCTLGSLPDQQDALKLLDAMMGGLAFYSKDRGILENTAEAGFESVVTPPLGSGGDRYYDDNAWLGLALVRHYELTGDPALVELAQRVFAFVASGWSDNPAWRYPGGIRWKEPKSNVSRNTCANGPAAELAARLFDKTRYDSYGEWSSRIYTWTRDALLNSEGLYADRMTPDGTVTPTIWSYNQGTMIGAGVLISRQTGDSSFLDQAAHTAGTYVGSRDVSALIAQDPAFNAVLFRNLLMLDEVRPDRRYRALMAEYASAMWRTRRRRNGLFAGNGSPLNNSAAMVQIYSLMAGASAHP